MLMLTPWEDVPALVFVRPHHVYRSVGPVAINKRIKEIASNCVSM